jgi:hypothetical protein
MIDAIALPRFARVVDVIVSKSPSVELALGQHPKMGKPPQHPKMGKPAKNDI